jgi:hypothetical protein
MATSFSGGRSRSTRREPPTMGKQLVYQLVVYDILFNLLKKLHKNATNILSITFVTVKIQVFDIFIDYMECIKQLGQVSLQNNNLI